MSTLKSYILDDATTVEYQRLDLMSKILDPWTRGYFRSLGVGPGWNCLEVGSGNGSVTEWLCEVVGCAGSVTAIDINPVLVDLIPAQNLTVTQADIRTAELPDNTYDVVPVEPCCTRSPTMHRECWKRWRPRSVQRGRQPTQPGADRHGWALRGRALLQLWWLPARV